jgi:hypothetical protein
MLGAQGLWAGRDLYRATLAVTRGLGFSGLIRRTAPFSRLLRHARGCWLPILTRILKGTLIWNINGYISEKTGWSVEKIDVSLETIGVLVAVLSVAFNPTIWLSRRLYFTNSSTDVMTLMAVCHRHFSLHNKHINFNWKGQAQVDVPYYEFQKALVIHYALFYTWFVKPITW